MGLGIYFVNVETRTPVLGVEEDDSDIQVGFQGIAGAKFFLTKNLALFAEYKFVHTGDVEVELTKRGTPFGAPTTETGRYEADLISTAG